MFKFSVSVLIFCLDDLPTVVSEVLKSPAIIVLPLINLFACPLTFAFIYLVLLHGVHICL